MNIPLLARLHKEGLISESSFKRIKEKYTHSLFSVHWELKVILYLGILLLTGGLGILLYKNIDTIGHKAVLIFIGLISAASFYYCIRLKPGFSPGKVEPPNAFYDYVLLLGCLSLLSFIAYFQYQFNIFGDRYGLATFIPMIVLFITAYAFDHPGILSLAITNLAAWLGIAITPLTVLKNNDFNNSSVILAGIFLGIFLITAGFVSRKKQFKPHFEFTYTNFGMHMLFLSGIAAMFHFYQVHLLWFLLVAASAVYFYMRSKREQSFYYLLVSTLYAYFAISYVLLNLIININSSGLTPVYLGFIYFITSGIGMVVFLMRTNKMFKKNDRL